MTDEYTKGMILFRETMRSTCACARMSLPDDEIRFLLNTCFITSEEDSNVLSTGIRLVLVYSIRFVGMIAICDMLSSK